MIDRLEVSFKEAERLYLLYAVSDLAYFYGFEYLPDPSGKFYVYSKYVDSNAGLYELYCRSSTLGVWRVEYNNISGKRVCLELEPEVFDYYYGQAIEKVHEDFLLVDGGESVSVDFMQLIFDGEVYL